MNKNKKEKITKKNIIKNILQKKKLTTKKL